MNALKYYIAAFSAFFMWGFFSIALKAITAYSSFDILFFRIVFSTFLIVLFSAFFRKDKLISDFQLLKRLPSKDKSRTLLLTSLGGLLLGLNWFLFIYVVNQVNVQSASFAYLICPIITTFFAFLILKEKIEKHQWIAILISLIGCGIYYVTNPGNLIYAFIIAATYSIYLVSQKKNVYFDKFNVLLVQMFIIFLLALPYCFLGDFVLPTDFDFYFYIILIAVLFTIIPLYLNLYALKGISASTVGILIYINPIITFVLAIFYFKESINMLQIGSYLLILCSIVVFNYKIINLTKLEPSKK
ncbi:EamA family transporter [Paenimyroides tangerinum]|uniref:EamA family transporter n=1 Tax=Paenimyroides tangerinum TaxID=2488728 RepID=A0A3P3WCW6_9FLAO|nr:EamA family transporter [Paenimyroides tangerinum]RRJ91479.1 EamA family transporter [Paenimyroides tangerinum]